MRPYCIVQKAGLWDMFRAMRRNGQLLSEEEVAAVMERCTNGVLACSGDSGYPYAVPLSYAYLEGRIYFHSAKAGHKVDAINKDPRVSFAVIDEDRVVGREYTTYFRSVIAFGRARLAEGDERLRALRALVEKYSGDQPDEAKRREVEGCARSCVVAIDIEHIAGKEAAEFVKAKGRG